MFMTESFGNQVRKENDLFPEISLARGKYYSFAKTTMRIRPESGNDENIIGKIKASHGLG